MLEKYIKIKNDIEVQEKELNNSILKGKEELDQLQNSISECQTSLEKGNGFSQILISQYQSQYEKKQVEVLHDLTEKKGQLEKSKKVLSSILDKNPKLKPFEVYSKVITSDEFQKSLINLVESFKEGTVDSDILEKAKRNSLKFKEIDFEGKKYHVKDNRKNYSDMIIFNQDNKILFVKRNKEDEFEPGKYALPGGHVEPAENPLLAAIREVEEELGIKVEKNNCVSVGKYDTTDTLINYFCTKIDDTLTNMILEERELQQYEWVELDDIENLDLIMNLKDNFEKVITIPIEILNNKIGSKEIAAFYGISIDNVPGSGYPV